MQDMQTKLAHVAALTPADLRTRWVDLTGKPVPQVRPSLLRLALAWELQAAAWNGNAKLAQKRLAAQASGSQSALPRPGSRLVREWKGVLHTVSIGTDGTIIWDGKNWNSLSEVARAITGTRWSGPAFFGLKKRRSAA